MIKRLAVSGITHRMLLGLAILVSSQAAMAQTTTLLCDLKNREADQISQDEPTTIELNDANSTVTVHFSALHDISGNGTPPMEFPAETTPPLPAQFGSNTITFTYKNQF